MRLTTYLFMLLLCLPFAIQAQIDEIKEYTPSSNPTLILTPKSFHVSHPVRDSPVCDDLTTFDGYIVPKDGHHTSATMSDKRKRKLAHLNSAGKSSIQNDPLTKSYDVLHQTETRAPITSFEGIGLNASPPDPSMAVGPNHIVTMENGLWAVYDKSGNIAAGFPKPLNDPLSGPNHADSAGDPVVMYDREADRWFLSQFQLSGNPSLTDDVFLIGVSTTPDPTGAYNVYEYELAQGNDYPHYGVWGDSYVTAGNFTGAQKVYTFNRNKMLAGDPTAEIVGYSPANLGASGFAAPIPVHSEAAGAATGPIKIVYYQDDAFNGVNSDHIGMWTIDMNWNNIPGSVISGKTQIPTAPFDAAIAGGFANLQQPGTNQRIDAIVGAVMNMSHWYKFPSHESILLNWVVEVTNGSQISGIRWVELRSLDNGATWNVYQEGTFTDPTGNESVFMGCISMDKQGNIGLGYTKTGNTTFPSLYYTGRMANDPLGTMTVAEDLAIAGNTVTTNDRYGDYGQGVRDPVDDLTFWITSEYSGAPDKKVRVYSFKLGTEFTNDVAITSINSPSSANGLSNAETVEVTITNLGSAPQSNIPVSLSFEGSVVANEVFTGTIAGNSSATYTFTQTVDVSTVGQTYSIESCTGLTGDENNANNCTTANVTHLQGVELAVTAILSPTGGANMTASEDVVFTITNNGGVSQSNIPITIVIDGGAPANGTFPGPLAAGASVNVNAAGFADVSTVGPHEVCVTVNATNDGNVSNNELCLEITTLSCVGTVTTGCNADGIKQLVLAGITVDNGAAGCNTEPAGGPAGYANRTGIVFDLERNAGSNPHILQASTLWNPEAFSAWIDFDNNGVFDVSEQLIDGNFTNSNGTLDSFNLVIPANAPLGNHVMRLKAFDSSAAGSSTDPCGTVAYGETHDYTVNIIDSNFAGCDGEATWTAAGWANNIAGNINSIVTLNADYDTATDGNLEACGLVISNGAMLTIDANFYALVEGNIVNNGTIIVEHTGSVVQNDDAATVTNNGTINVNVTSPTLKPRDFMVMGSPMDADVPVGLENPIFRKLQHTTADFLPHPVVQMQFPGGTNFVDSDNNDWSLLGGNYIPGRGYYTMPQPSLSSSLPNTEYDMQFANGTLNNGIITNTMTLNNVGTGAENKNASPNILSNPYPSAISASDFMAANDGVDEVYFWEHNTTPNNTFPGANSANFNMADISTFNDTGFNPAATGSSTPAGGTDFAISTAQGFGVKYNGNAGGVDATFNNSMRRTTGNTTLRGPSTTEENRLWVSIKSTQYQIGSTALIGFMDNATAGYDASYDSPMLGSPVTIYSHLEDGTMNLGIQGREAFNAAAQIPMGFISQIAEDQATYSIAIAAIEGAQLTEQTVYLVDHVAGILHNLSDAPYPFTAAMGIHNERFTVQFTDESILNTNDFAVEAITAFPNPTSGIVTISSPQAEILNIQVTDIQGRIVRQSKPNSLTTTIDLTNQNTAIYFVEITTEKGSSRKKVIRK